MLNAILRACLAILAIPLLPAAAATDPRVVVSRADLDYATPVARSEEGMPVGNGRMGSLVWTSPSALKFQINRVDVFAMHASSVSFPRADSDYAAGCGYVDINLASAGDDVFAGGAFHQHLSLHDALMTARGAGVTARVVAWPQRDVMAIEFDDERPAPEPVNIDLRMLRYQTQFIPGKNYELAKNHTVEVHTAEHVARSQLAIRDGRILLIQQFEERDFHGSSAVAIGVVGRPARARYLNESTVQLSAAAGRGSFTVLIGSAASLAAQPDPGGLALAELEAAATRGFDGLRADTAKWWSDFWARGGHVALHSADGQADFVGENYTYNLYLMGASSRGRYPPRFGGLLWRTTGDLSRWGSQYWWANTSAYYRNLMPAGRLDLVDPVFDLYSGIRESCALAARQQWGSEGHWIPEIVFFDGLEELPGDIAAELQDLMLVRKPYDQRSAKFQAFAEVRNRHHARWNFQADGKWVDGKYVVPTKGNGIFGHCTHILGAGARIADLYWQRYQYTMDEAWLRERAYPMIRGMAEFYRHFPNLQKGSDGIYHIRHVNSGESEWGSSDTAYEVGAMHLIFPLAIRAAEILGLDAEVRPAWLEIKDHLPPPPARPYVAGATGPGGIFGAFVYGGPGDIEPLGAEPELKRKFLSFNRLGSFIDDPGIGGARIFRNRLRLREGPGAIDAEHIAGLSNGIHSSLLDSTPADGEQGEPVLRVFPAWPKDWDADFALLARGAFTVSAAQTGGAIGPVIIESHAGQVCRLQNPWGGAGVQLTRDGRPAEKLSGALLAFPTRPGEKVTVTVRP
ncbi:MAG TPA: DUF5703 domain-containing protein [Lacunisphaera sp.]|nr:DUF5703 domain-containing protein [Lacunisphaera sp.]